MIPDALLWALRDAPVANVEEWAILVCMAGRADPDGCNTFQAVDTIAEAVRLSPDTVKRRQRAMLDRGLLALGDQEAAHRYRPGHRPTVYDLQVPYDWFGTGIDRVNRDRAKDGLPPLTPQDRPPLGGPPEKPRRKDAGVPRPKPNTSVEGANQDSSGMGSLEAPPQNEADGGARGGACEGATSTPTYKDLSSFGGETNPASLRSAGSTDSEPDALPGLEPATFDDFWAVYPRREARRTAETAWRAAVKRASPDVIVAGARRYAEDPNLPPLGYRPHPATWLRGDRWSDGPCPPRSGGGQVAAAGGGIARINSHFAAPGATFGMPGEQPYQPPQETPR